MRAFEDATVWQLLHPRYWLLWCGDGLLRVLAYLPFKKLMRLGARVGKLLYRILPKQRHIARTNLSLCFPELSKSELEARVHAQFRSLGQGAMEFAIGAYTPEARLENLFTVEGKRHLEAAQAQQRPIILITGHFHSLPLLGPILSRFISFHTVMRPQRNRLFNARFNAHAQKRGVTLIHRHDVRTMTNCLKNKGILLYLPDQDYGPKHSVFAPFFGVPAASTTALVRLAKQSNALILPVFLFRSANGYILRFHPVLFESPDEETYPYVERINKTIEDAVRVCPEQYLWVYKRFRTRPAGEADLYRVGEKA